MLFTYHYLAISANVHQIWHKEVFPHTLYDGDDKFWKIILYLFHRLPKINIYFFFTNSYYFNQC